MYGQPEYKGITADMTMELHRLERQLKVPPKDAPGATGNIPVADPGDDH